MISVVALLSVSLVVPVLSQMAPVSSTALVVENFDDDKLSDRGWYDITRLRVVPGGHAGGGCLEYEWPDKSSSVQGSSPMRHRFAPTGRVYLRYYLKLSSGWGWSGRNYHPHLSHFMTTENSAWHGPAASHLTVYIEPVNAKLRLAAQDIQNRDQPHGLTQGPILGGYNGRFYDSQQRLFEDAEWHCVEAYFQLNSIDVVNDRARADGVVRGWFDGKLVVDETDVILRSPDFPQMEFNQFLLAPYFGPGLLPHPQKLWIDDLLIARERPAPGEPRVP